MNISECVVPSCGSFTSPEIPWSVKMSTPTLKQEIPCIDASSSNSSHSVCTSKHLQSSEYVNYYDKNIDVLEQIKKEFPEDNKKLFYTECDLVNDGDIREHYDVPVTAQCIENKFLDKTIQDSDNFLKHNNEVINNALGNDGTNELHECNYCDKRFDNYSNMLVHISTEHHKINKLICDLCGKEFKKIGNLQRHLRLVHQNLSEVPEIYIRYICDYCGSDYNNKANLAAHIKRMHYDYGKSFDCWCGKQFRTPNYLSLHMSLHRKKIEPREFKCEHCDAMFYVNRSLKVHVNRMHSKYEEAFKCWCGKQYRSPIHLKDHQGRYHSKFIDDKFQCDTCDKVFKLKFRLLAHIKRKHYDYGRTFECCCGKKFASPKLLFEHKTLWHNPKYEKPDNEMLKCEHCQEIFKGKDGLAAHVKRSHYDCGKIFKCTCGKQFFTPKDLRLHRKRQKSKGQDAKNDKFQCESCQAFFKTMPSFIYHIKKNHYDYGRMFECWCGKVFRSPIHLRQHNIKQHKKFKCDSCQKVFKYKQTLAMHIKRTNYDCGRKFECWCGEQFSSPKLMSEHNTRWHERNRQKPNDKKFKCDSCLKFFKLKRSLADHIKKFHYDYGRVFECWCGKEFRSPMLLREHKWRHNRLSENKFQCDVCLKIFKARSNLIVHIKKSH